MNSGKLNNVFSPFFYENYVTETSFIQEKYLDKIFENYEYAPGKSQDWAVHTSYNMEDSLPNRIDWNISLDIYRKYIDDFMRLFFGSTYQYNVNGSPWYTVYGNNQNANTHEHIPDHFSVVHFLKFNSEKHWPITFLNPQEGLTKYLLTAHNQLKEKINFNNIVQSHFHPRFTPKLTEGSLIIFPGHLPHLVEKNFSDELRITIAFNISLT